MDSLNKGVRSDSRGTSVRQWSFCTRSKKVHGIFRQIELILRDDPLIAVHRKSYFLPAGWISQVVVSNISSKASIYGFCCLSLFFFSFPAQTESVLGESVGSFVWLRSSIIMTEVSHSCQFSELKPVRVTSPGAGVCPDLQCLIWKGSWGGGISHCKRSIRVSRPNIPRERSLSREDTCGDLSSNVSDFLPPAVSARLDSIWPRPPSHRSRHLQPGMIPLPLGVQWQNVYMHSKAEPRRGRWKPLRVWWLLRDRPLTSINNYYYSLIIHT